LISVVFAQANARLRVCCSVDTIDGPLSDCFLERDETADADVLVDQAVAPLKKAKLTPVSDAHAQEELPEQDTKTQYAPARKAKRSKAKSASTRTETLVNTSSHPDWYEKVSPKASFSRGDVQKLAHTRTLIQHCIEAHNRGDQQALDKAIVELTEQLHEIEFYPFLSMVEVKKSNVLGSGGLYLIFGAEPGHQRVFPYHLRADAEVLYSRWFMGDLEPSLLRGLVTLKSTKEDGKTRNYNSGVIEEYSFQKSAKVFGDNGLRNGQWFANRLCAMRDGAHAELEPGICGQKGKGAFSIVLANGGYADEDKGDVSFLSYIRCTYLTRETDHSLLWHAVKDTYPYLPYPAPSRFTESQ
jgi:hypothetical protein